MLNDFPDNISKLQYCISRFQVDSAVESFLFQLLRYRFNDLLSRNQNDKSPVSVSDGIRRFVISKEKVNNGFLKRNLCLGAMG